MKEFNISRHLKVNTEEEDVVSSKKCILRPQRQHSIGALLHKTDDINVIENKHWHLNENNSMLNKKY